MAITMFYSVIAFVLSLYIGHATLMTNISPSYTKPLEVCSHLNVHITETGNVTTVECQCMLKNIICKNLKSIPNFRDSVKTEKWRGIYLPKQNITQIPRFAFTELRVKAIILNMNPIGSRISPNAFTGR